MKNNKTLRQSAYVFLFLLVCALVTAMNASDNPVYAGVKLRDSSVFSYMGK